MPGGVTSSTFGKIGGVSGNGGGGVTSSTAPHLNPPGVRPGGASRGPQAKPHPSQIGGKLDWLTGKLALAGHDIAAMPTGILDVGKAVSHDMERGIGRGEAAVGLHNTISQRMGRGNYELPHLGKEMAKGTYESLRHPLRDPFQTALNVGAVASMGAGAVARGAAAADAARAADEAGIAGRAGAVAKALTHKPLMPTRALHVPSLLKDENGDLQVVHQPVHMVESHAPLARAYQALHDRVLQRSLNKNLTAEKPSLVARYANSRVGKANDEEGRIAVNANAAQSKMLARAKPGGDGIKNKDAELGLFMRSANVLPHEIGPMWKAQAEAGVNPELTGELSKAAGRLHKANALKLDEKGNVAVNAEKFPHLAKVNRLTKSNQQLRDMFIRREKLMSPEGMQARNDLVGRTIAKHNNSLADVEPHIAKEVQSRLAKVEKWHAKATVNAMGKWAHLPAETQARLASIDPEVQRASDALTHMRNRFDEVGGEQAVRPGQDYTDLSISKKKSPRTPFARSSGNKIPQPKKFSVGQQATGEGVAKGLIPDSTTRQVARSSEDVLREIATREHRANVYRFGSDVKRFKDDVLAADPHALKLNKIPLDTKQLLGLEHSTLNTLPAEDDAGIAAALKAKAEDALPRLISPKAAKFEDNAGIGTEAPGGYRWVPRKVAGDLLHPGPAARSPVVKGVDNLNSAITGATVYFKLSHIPQRLATDATTSLLNGALKPGNLRAAAMLKKGLTDQEFNELTAATGTHGYQALPAEGESKVAQAARGGAAFYAHRIDSPFRFINLVHEARKAGMDNPAAMRSLIDAAKDPAKATARQLSVLKRANRVSMIYDGLGPTEKATIARGLWFYPWTKAAFRFTGHTIAEHPLAAAVGGALGAKGRETQAKELGPLPYYEENLTPLGGNLVSNFGTLSPYSTASNVLETPAHADQLRSNLNPAAAALVDMLTGTNSYGRPEKRGTAALADLTAPTPEGQLLSGFLARHSDQSKKMFPNSGAWYGMEQALLRALGGQPVPRRVNRAALKKATEKWRTISIPVP